MKIFWKIILMVMVATLAACSDGSMSPKTGAPGGITPALNAPKINAFTVKDANNSQGSAGDSAAITSGGSVILSWDVTGYTTLEIARSGNGKKLDKIQGDTGSITVDGLMADEAFELTASGDGVVPDHRRVTVTVSKKEITIIKFDSDPATIQAGQPAKLCWTISDPYASVVVKSGDVVYYSASKDPVAPGNAAGTTAPTSPSVLKAQSLLLLTKADAVPADSYATATQATPTADPQEGCGPQFYPQQTTKYTLTVADAGTTETQDYTLEVTAIPERPPTTRPDPPPVTTTATPPVRVSLDVVTPSIFAGEAAKFTVTTNGSIDALSMKVNGTTLPESQFRVSGSTITVMNSISGDYTVTIDGTTSNAHQVTVRNDLNYPIVRDGLDGIGMNDFGLVLAGNVSLSSNGLGLASMLGMGTANLTVTPVQKLTFGKDDKGNDIMYGTAWIKNVGMTHIETFDRFAPFSASSMTIDPKTGRIYVGVTGSILYTDNKGASWGFVDYLYITDNQLSFRNKAESHMGCGGVMRSGIVAVAKGAIVGLNDVCDLKVIRIGDVDRLLMATDQGVVYIDGVDAHLKNRSDVAHAMKGWTTGNVLLNKVVNKLAIAESGDKTLIIAAASDGVYLNSQNGDPKAWQQLDAAGLKDAGSVNALAISGNEIFAGTDKGLFSYGGLDTNGQWTPVSGSIMVGCDAPDASGKSTCVPQWVVKALAIDAADPATLYVGTDKGLKLSRDCGASFVTVTSNVGAVRNIATATEGGQSAVVLTSDKGLFSSQGVAGTASGCNVQAGAPPPVQAQTGDTGPGTVKPNS